MRKVYKTPELEVTKFKLLEKILGDTEETEINEVTKDVMHSDPNYTETQIGWDNW